MGGHVQFRTFLVEGLIFTHRVTGMQNDLIDQIMLCGILCRIADRFREFSERTLRFCQKLLVHDKVNHIVKTY